jgi:hypothetical protein
MRRLSYLISAARRRLGRGPELLPHAPPHVVHITSVHNTDDDRIIEIPQFARGHLDRMSRYLARIGVAVVSLPAEIYQIHDPELLVLGLVLKLLGRRVVYDVHEDYPRKVLTKDWIPRRLKHALALATSAIEAGAGRLFDAIVTATPTIAARFPPAKTITLCNYPRLEEFPVVSGTLYAERPFQVCYVGQPDRGAGSTGYGAGGGADPRRRDPAPAVGGPLRCCGGGGAKPG